MTWNELTDADKRRWALEQAGVAMRCGSADVESAIATARKIIDFINDAELSSRPLTQAPTEAV